MKITAIIPTYNREGFFQEAVWSVLLQSFKVAEIILVDDGSTDRTPLYASIFEKKIKYIRIPHRGVSGARNLGMKNATSEWFAFLDSDDLWLPRKIEAQVNFHLQNKDILISQTDEIWIRKGKFVNPQKKHLKYGDDFFERSLQRCLISPSAVMIHRKVIEDVGLFDETLPACEDYDLWLRLLLKYRVGFISKKLIVKRGGHPDQLSHTIPLLDKYRVYALEKVLNFTDDEKIRELIIKEMKKKLTILLKGAIKRGKIKDARFYNDKLRKLEEEKNG